MCVRVQDSCARLPVSGPARGLEVLAAHCERHRGAALGRGCRSRLRPAELEGSRSHVTSPARGFLTSH